MGTKHVSYAYDLSRTQFDKMPRDKNYADVKLAKHKKKGAPKLLLVLDWMPTEDITSGRLLSGATGDLLNNILQVTEKYYKGKKLSDFDWLAISHSVFKTVGESDAFRDEAAKTFNKRLEHIILEYKPDTVITFGPKPFAALNQEKITYANKNYQNWYGVPIKTKVKRKKESHKFLHVPTLSLNTLVNADGSGAEMGMAGYIARNLVNGLDQNLRYKIPKSPEFKTTYVDTLEKFDKMLKKIVKEDDVAIDTETENLNRKKNKMLTIQFASTTEHAYVLPFYHKDSPFLPKELRYITKKLKKYFEVRSASQLHVYTNAVFDLNVLRNNLGISFFAADVWDILAGEFVQDENMKFMTAVSGAYYYSLGNLSMQYGCTAYYDIAFGKEMRKTIVNTDMTKDLIEYCALDVIVPLYIKEQQIRRAKDIKYKKYKHMVRYQASDMLHSFSTWEYNGVKTDINYLFFLKSRESPIRSAITDIEKKFGESKAVAKCNKRLLKNSGTPEMGLFGNTTSQVFNIATKAHLHMLMFDVLKLKPLARGKQKHDGSKGDGKIDKKFQKTYKDVPEVAMYSELQGAKKLFSSYVKSFIKQWGRDVDMRSDSRIRPHFKFIDVVTGRTSASDPSLHQIPSRSELGKNIKRLFVTNEGRIVIKVDYSAHEVRCVALGSFVSTDRGMIMLQDIIDMPAASRPLVHSFNHATEEVELKAIGTTSIHPPEEDMYEIAYEGGTITVTGNHQIWSVTRNEYIRADDIQEGEELLVDD